MLVQITFFDGVSLAGNFRAQFGKTIHVQTKLAEAH
jgi:hypothetical protein